MEGGYINEGMYAVRLIQRIVNHLFVFSFCLPFPLFAIHCAWATDILYSNVLLTAYSISFLSASFSLTFCSSAFHSRIGFKSWWCHNSCVCHNIHTATIAIATSTRRSKTFRDKHACRNDGRRVRRVCDTSTTACTSLQPKTKFDLFVYLQFLYTSLRMVRHVECWSIQIVNIFIEWAR